MATYYIKPASDGGDDSTGNGTIGTPWATISKAHTEASDGDTIVCLDSTATYTFTNQTFTKTLTITGEREDAGGAVFRGSLASQNVWRTNANLTFSKITIENTIVNQSRAVMFVDNVANKTVNIDNCIFQDIYHNLTASVSGVASIFSCFDGSASGNTLNLTRCLIRNVGMTSSFANPPVVFNTYLGSNNTFNITGCTVNLDVLAGYGKVQYVARSVSGSGNIANFKNTIIYTQVAVAGSAAISVTRSYSCFYNIIGFTTGTGVITSDPLFVDPDNGVFELRPTSPCIGTGTLL